MKKPLIPALLLILLLSACGKAPASAVPGPVPTVEPPAASAPAPTPTPAPAVPTPVPGWWEGIAAADLPGQAGSAVYFDGVACYLLGTGELEGEGVSVYCGVDETQGGYLLRRGDWVQYFPGQVAELAEKAPLIQAADYDGDGAEELLVIYYPDPQAAQMHIYEWENRWIDRDFGPEYYNPVLLGAITFQYEPRTFTVSCRGKTASYSPGEDEAGRIGLYESFDGMLFYRVKDTGLTAVFGIGAQVNGDVRYFATLTAKIGYDGTDFSLTQFELAAMGGV